MSWITSASLSSTTSSRASSTSTPLAKCPRSCSETALVSRLPTALHHSFLSLSPCLHLSPHPMASCPCLPLTPSTNTLLCSHVQGMVWSLFLGCCPALHAWGGRRSWSGSDVLCALPACPWEMVPSVHLPSMLRAGAAYSASSYTP